MEWNELSGNIGDSLVAIYVCFSGYGTGWMLMAGLWSQHVAVHMLERIDRK